MFYRVVCRLLMPLMWWGRVRVIGLDVLPIDGPLLVVANHDSQMDPIVLAVSMRKVRPIRYLARADLWQMPGLSPILNGLRQIPVKRGAQDASAMAVAAESLRRGEAIGIFPEGKLSRGELLRARSGVTRLHEACREANVVLAAISGTTDYVRFPKRPRVSVELFAASSELADSQTLLDAVRTRVPPVVAGRGNRRDSS